ncbi:MAG: WG repeat-containing protein [Bacteroidetes bacterium]|nr:WG repeat-containing protein [Bacteroidota bacterium]
MKRCSLIILFIELFFNIIIAQSLINPDKAKFIVVTTNDTVLTKGVYKIFYNNGWEVIDSSEEAVYYRIIKINSLGIPYDTVRDYYYSGDLLQWKGGLSSVKDYSYSNDLQYKGRLVSSNNNITVVPEGVCTWYNVYGGVTDQGFYINGAQRYKLEGNFNEGLVKAIIGDWGNYRVGFIDRNGVEIVPVKYDNVEVFSEGLALVKLNNKYGFVDKNGKEVIPIIYENALSFHDQLAAVRLNDKCGYIDKKGELIIGFNFQHGNYFYSGLASVMKNDKWGYINKSGVELTEFNYDSYYHEYEGFIQVKIGEKWGFIDSEGKEVIPVKYEDAGPFYDGLSIVELNGKYGCINKKGETVIPFNYDQIGHMVLPPLFGSYKWDRVIDYEGLSLVKIGYKYGYINRAGEIIVSINYDDAYSFSNGLAAVKLNDKWGFINTKGEISIPMKYDDAAPFNSGLACVKLNEKWGYIDNKGEVKIPFIYDSHGSFSESGIAEISFNYLDNTIIKTVYINTKGETIGVPKVKFPKGEMVAQFKILESAQEKKYFIMYYDKSMNAMGWCFNSDKETALDNAFSNCKSYGGRNNAELVINENRADLFGAVCVASNESNNYYVCAFSHYSTDDAEKRAKDAMLDEYNISNSIILSSWIPNENISSGYAFKKIVIKPKHIDNYPSSSNTFDKALTTATNVLNVITSQNGSVNSTLSATNMPSSSTGSRSTCICTLKHCLTTVECYCDGSSTPCGNSTIYGTLVNETRCCIGRGVAGQATYKAGTVVACGEYACNGTLAYDQTFIPAGPGPNTFVVFKGGTVICFIGEDFMYNGRDNGRVNSGVLAQGATINGNYYEAGSFFMYNESVICFPY